MQPPHHKKVSKRELKRYQALASSSYQPARKRQPRDPDEHIYDIPEKSKKRFGWKRALLLLFILLLTPLLVIGIWDYRNFAHASQKLFGTSSALGLAFSKPLETTPEGRVNILLVGYSVDDPGHAGAKLTDSILVVSLNKDNHTGYMLSVPRDLYVDIPAYGQAKINEAYQAGERQAFNEAGYDAGGIGLLEQVLHETMDIPINYYAFVDYTAVREIVNALGGVAVDIKSPDPRGLYDPNFKPEEGGPLKLSNGPQVIDGQTALRLTRARGSTYGSYGFPLSDFNRTEHQQQVFSAIQSQLNWKLVLDPRTNEKIFNATADNLTTNVELAEVIPLYRLLSSIPQNTLKQVNLRDANGVNLLRGYTTPYGQSALVPSGGINNYKQIRSYISELNQQ